MRLRAPWAFSVAACAANIEEAANLDAKSKACRKMVEGKRRRAHWAWRQLRRFAGHRLRSPFDEMCACSRERHPILCILFVVAALFTAAVAETSLLAIGHSDAAPITTVPTVRHRTECKSACRFVFPSPDVNGIASVTMTAVEIGVRCPPGPTCTTPADEMLDRADVMLCAGSRGADPNPAALSLELTGQHAASVYGDTYDTETPAAFGSASALASGECAAGWVYFLAPIHSQWVSLNYEYNGNTQRLYAWIRP